MLKLIKHNIPFLSIYGLFIVSIVILLNIHGKEQLQILANQYYSPFWDVTFFWSTKIVEWFSLLVIILIFLFRGAKFALMGMVIYGLTAAVTFGLKRLVFIDHLRPSALIENLRLLPSEFGMGQLTAHSFPSGHTTAAFTLFCFLAIISKHRKMGFLFGIIAAIVGYSRVYLSQHFFEDIAAGATLGTFLALLFYYFLNKINVGAWADKPLIKL